MYLYPLLGNLHHEQSVFTAQPASVLRESQELLKPGVCVCVLCVCVLCVCVVCCVVYVVCVCVCLCGEEEWF